MFVSSDTKHFTFVKILFLLVFHENCFIFHYFLCELSSFWRFWTILSKLDKPIVLKTLSTYGFHESQWTRKERLVWVESLHCELNHAIGNKLWENRHLNNSLTKTFYSSGFDNVSSWKITVVQLRKNMYLGTLLISFCFDFKNKLCFFFKRNARLCRR